MNELPSSQSIVAQYVSELRSDGTYYLALDEEQTKRLWVSVDALQCRHAEAVRLLGRCQAVAKKSGAWETACLVDAYLAAEAKAGEGKP